MKTTIDIADALFERAKVLAERDNTTLRALVEEGLRSVFEGRAGNHVPFKLLDSSVPGNGLRSGIDLNNRDLMIALIYEARGG